MSQPRYIVGIDLGTTNCAVAFTPVDTTGDRRVSDFPVSQLLRPGEAAARPLLPSFLYLTGEHELPAGSTQLPWGESLRTIVGEFARWQGSRVPGRLISSAKSWLCHAGVDRTAPILPWAGAADVKKISPVEASANLLKHMVAAWNDAHKEAPLAEQEVVITVPASFDEAARALTAQAIRDAGLQKYTLLEEPQAAFYDFAAQYQKTLADALKDVRLVLVIDIGGGTSDFTLIQVGTTPAGPALKRIAVGEHLMLGGDNMDTALARIAEERFGGRKLTGSQWSQLVQAARNAKESLLSNNDQERSRLAIAGEGSRLLGGTLSTELARSETEDVILNGFFPACGAKEMPRKTARVALQELGLPYAQEPAITRHLAAFLRLHAAPSFAALGHTAPDDELPRPGAILLNGGVFNSPKIVQRLVEVVSSWWPTEPAIRLLPHTSLELAVARGAAYYGLSRRGIGRRISGGSAHALYVGLATEKHETKQRAICLIPRGQEEGEPIDLTGRPFTLTVGQPVQFPLFSTTSDRLDAAGDVVEITDELRPLPPIHTVFKAGQNRPTAVPVHLRGTLTELGTLELWCVSNTEDARWRLEFELRGTSTTSAPTVTEAMPARFGEVRTLVERIYGSKAMALDSKEAKQLLRTLEKTLGPREAWRLPVLREIWATLMTGASRRKRSADHERAFCQLIGYSLRPGFGYALDEWRCEQTFRIFHEGVKFHAESPVWNEFWILWRRIAGGLTEAHQNEIWNVLKPQLGRKLQPHSGKQGSRLSGVQPQGLDEMIRTAASLENIESHEKVELGAWIAERLKDPTTKGGPWAWALGRLGTRVPLYGSSHRTVPPQTAEAWASLLLEIGLDRFDGASFAATQIARLTNDRTRNVSDATRSRVVDALRKAKAPEAWIKMVTEVVQLEAADEARALGDTLPVGLRLKE